MKILALDISTKAGWALLETCEGALPKLLGRGIVQKDKIALEYGPYPEGFVLAAEAMGGKLKALIETHKPEIVVIEETNQTKSRYVQKMLEWIHLEVLSYWRVPEVLEAHGVSIQVHTRDCRPWPSYISTGTWKATLGLKKPADAKQNDKLLKKAKEMVATSPAQLTVREREVGCEIVDGWVLAPRYDRPGGGVRISGPEVKVRQVWTLNEAKKQLGIRGKWTKKMLAVNWVNENYGLKLKLVNNDEAEAICLGVAFLRGALLCDGDPNRGG